MTTKSDMNTEVLRELAKREMAEAKRLHAYNAQLDAVLTAHPLRLRDVFAGSPLRARPQSQVSQQAARAKTTPSE